MFHDPPTTTPLRIRGPDVLCVNRDSDPHCRNRASPPLREKRQASTLWSHFMWDQEGRDDLKRRWINFSGQPTQRRWEHGSDLLSCWQPVLKLRPLQRGPNQAHQTPDHSGSTIIMRCHRPFNYMCLYINTFTGLKTIPADVRESLRFKRRLSMIYYSTFTSKDNMATRRLASPVSSGSVCSRLSVRKPSHL